MGKGKPAAAPMWVDVVVDCPACGGNLSVGCEMLCDGRGNAVRGRLAPDSVEHAKMRFAEAVLHERDLLEAARRKSDDAPEVIAWSQALEAAEQAEGILRDRLRVSGSRGGRARR